MHRNIVFQAILAALLAAGCEDCKEGQLDEGPGAIAGTVMKFNGDPVADVQVYIRDDVFRLTTSKSDGTYELLDLPAGNYIVVAVSPEGIGTSAEATVFADLTTSLDLVLSTGGSLAGVVTLEGEQDHSGTLVYFPGLSFAGYTGRDGSFLIDSIIPGCYTVRAEHVGFYPKELESVCIKMRAQKTLPEMTLLRHTLPDCMSDDDCGPHQVCENRICSYVAGYSIETCDGKDNDDDGYVDEGVAQPCGPSQDLCTPGVSLCLGGEMSECKGGVLPQDERCDLLDNDCDGLTDEDFDADGDNYTSCGGDCDDADAAINPEGTEVCDLQDNDCNGKLDEGCPGECTDQLAVTVIAATDRQPVSGAHVTVVDDAGATHTADTDAAGTATFSSLATGPRRSITVKSDETVPPLPGPGGPDRPRYETTTVMGPCTDDITIPLKLTASGRSTPSMGTVVGKVPASVFAMLPHSWKCVGDCDSDRDCNDRYYCELDNSKPCGPKPPEIPQGACTPRSLLAFFNMGDPTISGQFRFAMLVPELTDSNFTYRDLDKIFARTTGIYNMWPGNLVTDDTFLDGLGPVFGREVWGIPCWRTEDCPNTIDYVCEEDPNQGKYRCKDESPMRNIRLEVPAGQDVKLVLVTGIMDVSMMEFLPVFLSILMGFGDPPSAADMLQASRPHTLHVCLFSADVAEGIATDISGVLAGLDASQCWSVDCTFTEGPVPMVIPGVQPQACLTNMDCCSDPGHCGWPDSRMMCLPDPSNPASTYCYQPLFRVQVVTNDEVIVEPDLTAFDPTGVNADTRLCSQVPANAPFELMCLPERPGIYRPCDPRDIRELDIPPDYECSFPYGIALATLDFPVGHARLPEGGRVFIGYDFIRSPLHHRPVSQFLVPFGYLDGSVGLSVTQVFLRNLTRMADGNIRPLPGFLAARASSQALVASLQLPAMASPPILQPPPQDAGFGVKVVFETEDPTVFPPVLERVYAVAKEALLHQVGVHELTYDFTATTLEGEDMVGVVLSRVDHLDTLTWVDPWWRVYAPPGTTSISLPPDASPFASGESVRVTPFGSDLEEPFNYDLFPVDAVLGPRRGHVEDSYAVIVP